MLSRNWKFKINIRKRMDSLSSTLETSENIFLFAFIPLFVSFEICICVQYFFDAVMKLEFP